MTGTFTAAVIAGPAVIVGPGDAAMFDEATRCGTVPVSAHRQLINVSGWGWLNAAVLSGAA